MASFRQTCLRHLIQVSEVKFAIRWTQTCNLYKTISTQQPSLKQGAERSVKYRQQNLKWLLGQKQQCLSACKPDPDQPNTFLFLLSPNSWEQPQKSVLCLVKGLPSQQQTFPITILFILPLTSPGALLLPCRRKSDCRTWDSQSKPLAPHS